MRIVFLVFVMLFLNGTAFGSECQPVATQLYDDGGQCPCSKGEDIEHNCPDPNQWPDTWYTTVWRGPYGINPPLDLCERREGTGNHPGVDLKDVNNNPFLKNGRYASLIAGPVISINRDGWGGGWGNYVVQRVQSVNRSGNPVSYMCFMGHLANNSIPSEAQNGRWFTCGDDLGDIGSTGNSTGPHGHWQCQVCDDVLCQNEIKFFGDAECRSPATDCDFNFCVDGPTVLNCVADKTINPIVALQDPDGDGFARLHGDCDWNNSSIHPNATENCNDGIDNNCNGLVDSRDPHCGAEPTMLSQMFFNEPVAGGAYDVGETISASVVLRNNSNVPLEIKDLTIGCRLNNANDCWNYSNEPNREKCGEPNCPEFTTRTNITIEPGQNYNYTGNFTPAQYGVYACKVYYRVGPLECKGWNWDIPKAASGYATTAYLSVADECAPSSEINRRTTNICPPTATPTNLPTPTATATPTASVTRTVPIQSTAIATRTSTPGQTTVCTDYRLVKLTEGFKSNAPLIIGDNFVASLSNGSVSEYITLYDEITSTKYLIDFEKPPGSEYARTFLPGVADGRRLIFQLIYGVRDAWWSSRFLIYDVDSLRVLQTVDLENTYVDKFFLSNNKIFFYGDYTTNLNGPRVKIVGSLDKDTLTPLDVYPFKGFIIDIDGFNDLIYTNEGEKLIEQRLDTLTTVREFYASSKIIYYQSFRRGNKFYLTTIQDAYRFLEILDLECETVETITNYPFERNFGLDVAEANGMMGLLVNYSYLRIYNSAGEEVYALDELGYSIKRIAGSIYTHDFYLEVDFGQYANKHLYKLECTNEVVREVLPNCEERTTTPTPINQVATATPTRTNTPTPLIECPSNLPHPRQCPPQPLNCANANKSSISIRMANNPRLSRTNRMIWRLRANNQPQRLVCNPTTVTQQTVCLYDGTELIADIPLPAGATCNNSPCWTQVNNSGFYWKNSDLSTHQGTQRVRVSQNHGGDISLAIQAKGENVPTFDLPILNNALIAQWHVDDSQCFESTFSDANHRIRQTSQAYIGR